MLGSIRDITTVIVVALLMFVLMLVFFMTTLDSAMLTAESFNQGGSEFKACASDYDTKHELFQSYENEAILKMEVEELAQMRTLLE